jgi:hypothetical protein
MASSGSPGLNTSGVGIINRPGATTNGSMEDVTMKTLLSATLLSLVIGVGSAYAQAPAAPAAAPAANPDKPVKKSAAERSEISKACSAQADAQKLKGKERKKFRSKCKRDGGKAT